MAYLQKFFPSIYRDSVELMQISARLTQMEGVSQVSLIMGTSANIRLLKESGMIKKVIDARNNDILFVATGTNKQALHAAMLEAEHNLIEVSTSSLEKDPSKGPPRSIAMGIDETPGANLALISCPGEYAVAEAIKALNFGLNVMLFSDSVAIQDEVMLKQLANKNDRILMGPDCGTAIINNTPLGFANMVKAGNIGIVSASGTGLQQVACLIDRWGGGISHAIGTGGRDLIAEVGGSTMIAGIEVLANDPNTHVIVLISKPPAKEVAIKILKKARTVEKPIVVNFLNGTHDLLMGDNLNEAKDLESAAYEAIRLLGIRRAAPSHHPISQLDVNNLASGLSKGRQYIRGLYSGGTFCFEAISLLSNYLMPIHSTSPLDPKHLLKNPWESVAHTVLDMGSDVFTMGRPHPMIDHRLRNERIVKEAQDPETAIILIDVVLGFGAHSNPAKEFAKAKNEADAFCNGKGPVFIASICGTSEDPQDVFEQEKVLTEAGVLVMESNAQAVRLATDIILGIG